MNRYSIPFYYLYDKNSCKSRWAFGKRVTSLYIHIYTRACAHLIEKYAVMIKGPEKKDSPRVAARERERIRVVHARRLRYQYSKNALCRSRARARSLTHSRKKALVARKTIGHPCRIYTRARIRWRLWCDKATNLAALASSTTADATLIMPARISIAINFSLL